MFASVAGALADVIKYAKTRHLTLLDLYPRVHQLTYLSLTMMNIPEELIDTILRLMYTIQLKQLVKDTLLHRWLYFMEEKGWYDGDMTVYSCCNEYATIVIVDNQIYHLPLVFWSRSFRQFRRVMCIICCIRFYCTFKIHPIFCSQKCKDLYYSL
jgi:hypothetical protein